MKTKASTLEIDPVATDRADLRRRRWATGLSAVALAATLLTAAGVSAADAEPEPVQVGQTAPDFTLQSSDGGSFTLSEMKDRKSVILVFFRGTW